MPNRAFLICGLFALEMILIVVAFQVLASVECRQTSIELACRGLRGAVVRTLCLGALLGVYLWARAPARAAFAQMVDTRAGGRGWGILHLLAVVGVFVPLLVVDDARMNADFGVVFPVLVLGAAVAVLAGLFWLAAPGDWHGWLRARRGPLLGLLALALLLPELARLIGPIWYWQWLTMATFESVAALTGLFVDELLIVPERQAIGTRNFLISVADTCSGVEGFALITAFLGIYALLFRDRLHMVRFWAVVWPLALMASWSFNVLRITALMLIGTFASPELAQNGFHSFAGWLFFILLAFGVLVVVNRVTWLQKGPGMAAPDGFRLAEDAAAARILPFIVFMLSGVLAQAFWTEPALAYPLQAGLMFLALWWVRRPLRDVVRKPGAMAIVAGAAIGAGWIWMAPGSDGMSPALAGLTPVMFGLWAAARIVGTVVFVPVIEELFFRGYLQDRIDGDGWPRKVIAIILPTALFALLHGRWLEAGVAGVVFGLLYMRSGRLADAVAAHAVANAIIAIVAAMRGDWALI